MSPLNFEEEICRLTKVVLDSASDNINYVMLKIYWHKFLINSDEFARFARHHCLYEHQPRSNTTKVVLDSAFDNINNV